MYRIECKKCGVLWVESTETGSCECGNVVHFATLRQPRLQDQMQVTKYTLEYHLEYAKSQLINAFAVPRRIMGEDK